MKSKPVLLGIVAAAILTRVFLIWVWRPEFVGWFNHTYYYYVQLKGLLANGSLPFNDMPILFYIYWVFGKLLMLFGMELNDAVVNSTRLVMCIVPSLIPLAVYSTIKSVTERNKINRNEWIIIFLSGFLPLTLVHVPEFSQKNALGFLLLFALMLYSFKLFTYPNTKNVLITLILTTAIVLSHFGTTAVMLLYALSFLLAYWFVYKDSKSIIKLVAILSVTAGLSVAIVKIFDPQRFNRIFFYLTESINNSFVADIISADATMNDKIMSAAVVLIPVIIFSGLIILYKRNSENISVENKLFWLSNIVFSYLLLLPVYDKLLFGRFALYLSIPVLFLLFFHINYVFKKTWLKNSLLILASTGTIAVGLGEVMSLKFHNRNKDQIFADLMQLKERHVITRDDLVLTKNGAEHICNWFLDVKAGLITSLNKVDFNNYNNIYVLNPIQGSLNFEGIENTTAENETDRYRFMMRNIPKPDGVESLYESKYIQFYKLERPPTEWLYDEQGNWISYWKN